MKRARRRQRGFTLLEAVIGTTLGLMAIGVVTALLTSTQSVMKDSRAQIRGASEHRRNMQSLATILQVVDSATLTGFGADNVATKLSFKRVTGRIEGYRTLSEVETIEWRPSDMKVEGVAQPGALWHVNSVGARIAADRVPQGGFRVMRDGKTLVIHLTTYYLTSEKKMVLLDTETSVSLRN